MNTRRLLRPLLRPALLLPALLLAALPASACSMPDLPDLPELPGLPNLSDLPEIPGLPDELRQIPDTLRELELPDLSGIELPSLDALPVLQPPPGAIVFNGPVERGLEPGDRLPGTDITFLRVENGGALFAIAGQESPRRTGDSLDFDGAWTGIPGSQYQARYRIYSIGENSVRAAGVHQLLIPDVQPVQGARPEGGFEQTFVFLDGVQRDTDRIAGTTYGYMGRYERGAQLSGVPENQYPYRSVGDSIEWEGTLRPGVGARYNLRLLVYGMESMRVGGVVTLTLPPP